MSFSVRNQPRSVVRWGGGLLYRVLHVHCKPFMCLIKMNVFIHPSSIHKDKERSSMELWCVERWKALCVLFRVQWRWKRAGELWVEKELEQSSMCLLWKKKKLKIKNSPFTNAAPLFFVFFFFLNCGVLILSHSFCTGERWNLKWPLEKHTIQERSGSVVSTIREHRAPWLFRMVLFVLPLQTCCGAAIAVVTSL